MNITRRVRSCPARALFLPIVAALTAPAAGQDAVLTPDLDNTIFFDLQNPTEERSSGVGTQLFAGRTFNRADIIQRALLRFPLAASVPQGSTVTRVELGLWILNAGPGLSNAPLSLRRVLASWGEGASNSGGGAGVPAEAGDATWFNRFFPGQPWAAPGGDFVAAASGSVVTGPGTGAVTFTTAPGLVDDVQAWVDDASTNFGWILRNDEATRGSARGFVSREGAAGQRPALRVWFTPPCPSDINRDRIVDLADFFTFFNCYDAELPCADIDGNPGVDLGDFFAFFSGYDAGC